METKIVIEGGRKLKGEVEISGSKKNACLPILAATLLTDEPCRIMAVPELRDIKTMLEIVQLLGKKVQVEKNVVTIAPTKITALRQTTNWLKQCVHRFVCSDSFLQKKDKRKYLIPEAV